MPWDFHKDGKTRLCVNNRESLGFIGILRARYDDHGDSVVMLAA